MPWERVPPGLVFVKVDEPKAVKNRLHLDLAPHTGDDRDAEIARLKALGATEVDVGQGPEVTWTVLADPQGNEFCVLSSRDTYHGRYRSPRSVRLAPVVPLVSSWPSRPPLPGPRRPRP